MNNSVTFKLLVIGVLCALLLIPATLIQNLVREREQTARTVTEEVSAKWGGQQQISGPVLSVPFREYFHTTEKGHQYRVRHAYFMADALLITGTIVPEIRKRSIHPVTLYKSELRFNGRFNFPDLSSLKIDSAHVQWADAMISIGIPDLRGIKSQPILRLEGQELPLNPNNQQKQLLGSAIATPFPLDPTQAKSSIPFQIDLLLNGSQGLYFIPTGRTTQVALQSSWPSPSFDGQFLPEQHTITETGFEANWQVLHLNRSFPQQWVDAAYDFSDSAFGLQLKSPVEHYAMSHRATKYALMFIVLSFVVFFFVEVLRKTQVHPIQYLLIGFSLVLFFLLLLSLSEHIGFGWAYLSGSVAIIGLVTSYSAGVLRDRKMTWLVGGLLSLLYLFLYSILQLEDYALLMGSVGLFMVMALLMYVSRKVDWYREG